MPEVSEFHEVFLFWLKEEEQSDEEEEEGDAAKPDKALSRDIVRRLIRTMGVRFTTETKETLDRQLEVFAGDSVDIDFPAFLHLMRWILDTDFGGLGLGRRDTLKNDAVETRGRRGTLKSAADDF
mmetsp:Transcript_77156/g.133814  ORF Transcript_77156/g.133814 Transcript_77156/m.133814 type:complete len:125 (+) Transcript_77156:2-376(+)